MTEDDDSSFRVSLSAFQTWQRCEQRYYFSYVRRLRTREVALPPTLGRMLHEYFESYYKAVKFGMSPRDAHLQAGLEVSNKFIPEINSYTNTALLTGNQELAKSIQDLPSKMGRLTQRYFEVRGLPDAERYEILYVEESLKMPIWPGIVSAGVADLVTLDRETQRLNLWEHKSTENVPQNAVRLRDFQTMLYGTKLKWLHKMEVDSIIWNYVRTKEPEVPEVLKSGQLTKRKNLDTTWEMYVVTAMNNGEDPFDPRYYEMKEYLDDREETVYFPRYENVIVVDEAALMNDYIEEAQRMRQARADWEKGVSRPVKTIMRDCDYCEYFKICQAALTGGDEEDVIRMKFNG